MKFNRNNIARNLALMSAAVLLTLLLLEATLRWGFGYQPGVHTYSPWFHQVDTLTTLPGFIGDEEGIFKIDTNVRTFLDEQFKRADIDSPLLPYPVNINFEAYSLDGTFLRLRDTSFNNLFKQYVQALNNKPSATLDSFELEVLHYVTHPVNDDGYRSISFRGNYGKRKKILLLGDSFTFGYSAQNLTSSFADILLAKGYAVFNTGISGADPAQYLQVARKYIAELKPDYVIVNFYMGNDIVYFNRTPQPHTPIHYATNAGNLLSCPGGIYFSTAGESYKFVVAHYTIPHDYLLGRICATTAITTLGWKVLSKLNKVTTNPRMYDAYWQKVHQMETTEPACNAQLQAIQQLALANHTQFLLLAIPDLKWPGLRKVEDVPGLFKGLPYAVPPVTENDYKHADGHYNDEGHRKHAEYILGIIN